MKISKDTIGNRIRDLPASSPVIQPTVPPRVPSLHFQAETNSVLATFFPKRTVSKIKLNGFYEFSRPLELKGIVVCPSTITVKNVTGNSQS
jgi:hypothetical protein